MKMKVKDAKHEILVEQSESKFNKACKTAWQYAILERSTDNIIVKFESYTVEGGMGGIHHNYTFVATIKRYDEEGNVK